MKYFVIDDGYFEGHVSLEHGDGWVRPWRLPFHELDLFTESQGGLIDRARESAGVRLRCATNATEIEIDFLPPATAPFNPEHTLDLIVESGPVHTVQIAAGATTARFEGLASGDRVVEIWLPHDSGIELTGMRLTRGAFCRVAPDPRPRWITYGNYRLPCFAAVRWIRSVRHGLA